MNGSIVAFSPTIVVEFPSPVLSRSFRTWLCMYKSKGKGTEIRVENGTCY